MPNLIYPEFTVRWDWAPATPAPLPAAWAPSGASRDRGLAPDDVHHGIFGEADVASDKPIGEAFIVEREDPLSLLVTGPLALFATKDDTAGLGRLEARFHPLPDEVSLHGAEVEAQAGCARTLTFHEWRSSRV